jgi:UDP:flavonoid glycosyltransferase YjiC (YdhE family)
MKPSYRIVFYVSGHGFGHASRSREVIRALIRRSPNVRVTIKTSAPRKLFERIAEDGRSPIEFMPFECDTGMLQLDSLHLDAAGSVKQAVAFYRDFAQKTEAESRFLTDHGADVVVGDIPPLAFAAAATASVPSVAVGNFTWDWIYEDLAETPADTLNDIRSAYAHASIALRLPMSGGFASMQAQVHDIPFVARTSSRDPVDVRRALGLALDRPMVLASFGAYGLALDMSRLSQLRKYTIVTNDFAGSGFEYQDLVRAADAVVTKPGYGIISECIANHTAVLYTSRGRFREYEVLVREMPKYLRTHFIEQEELLAGRWDPALQQLLALPPPPIRPDLTGAEVAAGKILGIVVSG